MHRHLHLECVELVLDLGGKERSETGTGTGFCATVVVKAGVGVVNEGG